MVIDFFDNGATSHVTNDLSNLSVQNLYTGATGIMVDNSNTFLVAHSGEGLLFTLSTSFFLSNILHVPSISHNLVFVCQFAKIISVG